MSGASARIASIPTPIPPEGIYANDLKQQGAASGIREIFVRPAPLGHDGLGDGSIEKPFLTPKRAFEDLTRFPPEIGEQVIDMTGLGVVNLAETLAVPAVFSGEPRRNDPAPRYPEFTTVTAVTLRAQPTTVTTIPSVVSDVADPVTGTRTLTVSGTPFTPGAHVGRLLIGAGLGEWAVIKANSSNTITYQAFFAYTLPARVCVESCELKIADPDSYDPTLVVRNVGCPVTIQGIKISHANPDGFAYALEVRNVPELFLSHGTVRGCVLGAGVSSFSLIGVHVNGGNWLVTGSAPSVFRCLFSDVFMLEHDAIGGVGQTFYLFSSFLRCTALGHGGNGEANLAYEFSNCEIENGLADGVYYRGGQRCSVRYTRISGCAGDGVQGEGPGRIDLISVIGTGNGGVGLKLDADSGCRSAVDAATTVAGTGGGMKVGANLARTWDHFRNTSPVRREIDLADPSTRVTQESA